MPCLQENTSRNGYTNTQQDLSIFIVVLCILSYLIPTHSFYSVQRILCSMLNAIDNVCRGHAARGTLAGKAVCEWWSGRAVAPISGVFFLLLFRRFTSITQYRLLQSTTTTTKGCIGLYCPPEVTGPGREDKTQKISR